MMIYKVYILKSKKDNKRYIGFTNNLDKRLVEHNNGKATATKNRRPFELIYYERFENKFEAAKREKFFKSGIGREFLKNINR
jgi:putative endonuclease